MSHLVSFPVFGSDHICTIVYLSSLKGGAVTHIYSPLGDTEILWVAYSHQKHQAKGKNTPDVQTTCIQYTNKNASGHYCAKKTKKNNFAIHRLQSFSNSQELQINKLKNL